jgi:hypothetical protein
MTSRSKTPLSIAAAVVLIAGLAAGGYLLGKSSGEDIDAARAAGTAAGQRDGAAKGAAQGYNAGRLQGRRQGYQDSFGRAYKTAYRKAFEDAGQAPPTDITVPSPNR